MSRKRGENEIFLKKVDGGDKWMEMGDNVRIKQG